MFSGTVLPSSRLRIASQLSPSRLPKKIIRDDQHDVLRGSLPMGGDQPSDHLVVRLSIGLRVVLRMQQGHQLEVEHIGMELEVEQVLDLCDTDAAGDGHLGVMPAAVGAPIHGRGHRHDLLDHRPGDALVPGHSDHRRASGDQDSDIGQEQRRREDPLRKAVPLHVLPADPGDAARLLGGVGIAEVGLELLHVRQTTRP